MGRLVRSYFRDVHDDHHGCRRIRDHAASRITNGTPEWPPRIGKHWTVLQVPSFLSDAFVALRSCSVAEQDGLLNSGTIVAAEGPARFDGHQIAYIDDVRDAI